jgi:hypothetical protein
LEVDRMMKVRKSRNNRKKRILAALCALTLAAGQMSVASAGEPADEEQESAFADEAGNVTEANAVEGYVESIYPDEEDLADNEELFAGYVQKMLYGTGTRRKVRSAAYGESRLTGLNLEIYRQLKAQIVEVAAGSLASTEFTVNLEGKLGTKTSWTAEELEVDKVSDDTGIDMDAVAALDQAIGFNFKMIKYCLLQDCPYELYWFDKTQNLPDSYFRYNSTTFYLKDTWTFYFPVVKSYAGSKDYTTDTTKTSAVTTTVETAKSIVEENADKSDYEKLQAYKDKICELVKYNDAAVAASYAGGYGDPWQIIYVFDGDTDTDVVCEGYAKAFQYLCDLSDFKDTVCYTVFGNMIVSEIKETVAHMWNIVIIDGNTYLVDITNSEEKTAGEEGGLFLVGPIKGKLDEDNTGYTFKPDEYSYAIDYKFDKSQISLYGEKLRFAEEKNHVTIKNQPDNKTVTEGYASKLQLQVKAATTENAQPDDKITYQWYRVGADGAGTAIDGETSDTYTFPLGEKEGTYQFYCEVSCGENTGGVYTRNSLTATVTVVANHTHQESGILYSGSGEKAPSCSVDGVGHVECTICQKILKDNVPVNKLGHDYGAPEFIWTADGTKASAKFTCQRTGCTDTEEGHEQSVTATVTAETLVQSTYTVKGTALYTAAVSLNGKSYTDTKNVTLPLRAHTWASTYTVDVPTTETEAETEPSTDEETEAGTAPSAEAAPENDSPKTPEKGDVVKDRNKKAEYAVTKIEDKKSGTAAYTKSTDKNATAISVPNTVKVDGVTYKVTSVQTEAFKNCKKLKSITIGSNITAINKRAFQGCSSLKTITIKSTKLTAKSLSSKAFAGIGKNVVIKVPKGKLKAYTKLFRKKGLSKNVKIIS